jgi:hypothetical protein
MYKEVTGGQVTTTRPRTIVNEIPPVGLTPKAVFKLFKEDWVEIGISVADRDHDLVWVEALVLHVLVKLAHGIILIGRLARDLARC